jgi:hypothetical protein
VLEFVAKPQMLLHTASGLRSLVSFLLVAVVYWLLFWRIIKSNRGNRVIESGSITLMLAILRMLLMKLTNLPYWVLPSLGLLVFVLCLLTMFFLLVQGVQAIRHRKAKAAALSDSVTDFATQELGYEPRNLREKWLLGIVYWGTILLVAFLLLEFVKAK